MYKGRHLRPSTLKTLAMYLLAIWSAIEVVFSWYYQWLAHKVQPVAPPSEMKHDDLSNIFIRLLRAGAAYAPRRPETDSDWILSSPTRPKHPLRKRGKLNSDLHVPTLATLKEGQQQAMADLEAEMDKADKAHSEYLSDEEDDDPLFTPEGKPIELEWDDPKAVEFREQLRTWFHHVPWETIGRDDVRTWLAWSCFAMPLEDVQKDAKKYRFLERTADMLEARTGGKFPPGRCGCQIMRLTLDPVNVVSRPFLIYAIANVVNWFLLRIWYPHKGATIYQEDGIDFVVRIPEGWTPERGRTEPNAMPVVYLHGLGFGLLQNHLLVKHLVHSLPTHPILMPLAHHTAQAIFDPRFLKPWNRPQLVSTLVKACERWGFYDPSKPEGQRGGVSMLSHSNGSVHHGWVLKDAPWLVRRSCFVDPVVFSLWEGDVCFSFVYRKPRTALEVLLYYFVASEPGIANYIQRHFNWCDNTLFFDDIPNANDASKTAFFIGGKDIIIDAARTRRYLERNGVKKGLHWDANGGHGDGLLGDSRDRVVMFVGTGNTRGWENWLTRGRRSHSLGQADFPKIRTALDSIQEASTSGSDSESTMRKRF